VSYCETGVDVTGGTVDGGHADLALADAAAVEPVDADLPAQEIAPLFCAGYTVYSALRTTDVRPDERVAVVGIGGLGHLAVQYARGLGATVIAVTGSADKATVLRELGASEVLVTAGGVGAALRAAGGVDVIVHTSASIESNLADGLRVGGRLAVAGVSRDHLRVTALDLIFRRLSVLGASPGPRQHLRELLRFHTAIGARTLVETFPLERAAEAIARVRQGLARYRVVLVPGAAASQTAMSDSR
jgi:D-arabinose 1-dehydrogenase-like Zn-dependent alcohol dehydrogenase